MARRYMDQGEIRLFVSDINEGMYIVKCGHCTFSDMYFSLENAIAKMMTHGNLYEVTPKLCTCARCARLMTEAINKKGRESKNNVH